MKREQTTMSPKDLVVVLKIAFGKDMGRWTYQSLASVLGLSPSQVHNSVVHLLASGLLIGKGLKGKVNREALADFMIHGARYVFPAVIGRPGRGLPAGIGSPLFDAGLLLQNEDIPMVWLHPQGSVRGASLVPIHPCVLEAIKHDPILHKALVHFDVIRVGRARERNAAEAFFRKSLTWTS